MKLIKKIGSVMLVGAMLLSLAACGASKAKKISADDFKTKLEEKNYEVVDYSEFITGEDEVKQALMAESEDCVVTYYVFDDSGKASDYWNNGYEQMKEIEKADAVSGTLSKSGDKFTVNIKDPEESTYLVCVKADDTVVSFMGSNNDAKTVKVIDDLVKELCY